eukprot:TRINITY_DN8763_c0_g1_i1.p1 TRINITY_DN8763_c0_g1~~TRINITY_DN8763_c0_g1_i1.p1  ORF type:complete len:223 (+),score=56.28 TRINITY_DN8763_c0_g1_i1:47-670(+)
MANNRVYIANLALSPEEQSTSLEDWLSQQFGQFSPVQKVFVMHDRKSKTGKLSAFVTLEDAASADRAIQQMHKAPGPDGEPIIVRLAEVPGSKPQQNQGSNQMYGNSGYNSYGGYNSGGGGGWNTNYGNSWSGSGYQQQPRATTSSATPSATGNMIVSNGKSWFEATDPSSGKTYYYTSTGETRWERPIEDSMGGTSYTASVRSQPY